MANDVRLEFAAMTNTGRVRLQNEDCIAISPSYGFAVLADGMGGYSGGEIASGIAIDVVKSVLESQLSCPQANLLASPASNARPLPQLLDDAIQTANTAILQAARAEPEHAGMGTTIVVAVIGHGTITIAHVGDSRVYRMRHGELVQLTRDHSLLQEQIDAGLIHPEHARFALNKNLVTRAVGVGRDMEVDTQECALEPSDVYLLCSDGLSDMLTDDEMAAILSDRSAPLQSICEALVAYANDKGGHDNISVILIGLQQTREEGGHLIKRICKWFA